MLSFAIIGGDLRYKILFDMLYNDGYDVRIYANPYSDNNMGDFDMALEGADTVILPIPASRDKKNIFIPKSEEELSIKDLFEKMNKYGIKNLFGGVIAKELKDEGAKYSLSIHDFFEQEYVAVLNAIPTAEGALQSAMQESDRTVFSSKCLVAGYGRCGKAIANLLKNMGADVSVTYRNDKDKATITANGIKAVNFYDLKAKVGDMDFIFNTVPAVVFDSKILKLINKKAVIIDIAQAPGGIDYSFARKINLRAFYCPGLPGRVAPFTAAQILKDAVLNICLSQHN